MKSRNLLYAALAGVAAILLFTYWLQREAPVKTELLTDTKTEMPSNHSSPTHSEDSRQKSELSPIQLGLRAALIEKRDALEQFEAAEQALAQLEEYVSALEKRGEDPADYAEEGLEQFRPAYSDFENAQQRLELAESIIEDLRPQLSVAEFKAVHEQVQQSDGAPVAK
ncbi:MAG: hypothetical protein AAF385_05335 [Pseudomonadota bacterium]